jgi:hypothetical protein
MAIRVNSLRGCSTKSIEMWAGTADYTSHMSRFGVLAIVLVASPVFAQAPPTGRLLVTVADQTGAVILGATVTVAAAEDATKAITIEPVKTSDRGIATIERLVPGRYTIQVEFEGFQTRLVKDVRVRAGDNKQVAVLSLESLKDSVTVQQSSIDAAADPRGPAFGTTLTREQLEALSDDPEELKRQLQEMAGPGAVIKVDSFEGGALPLKAQIRSIRISRDQFAAEHHSAGGVSVEIITQPGLGPLRMSSGMNFRDESLRARNPFTPRKGSEQLRQYNASMTGSLIQQKTSFNVYAGVTEQFETPSINIVRPSGLRSEAVRLRQLRDNAYVYAAVDHAATLDQTLRFSYNMNGNDNRNLGIGAYDEEERAFSRENQNHNFRAQQIGPFGRRGFLRTRLQVIWNDSEATSAVERPTIRVNDAFNSGGAQTAGGRHARTINAGADFDYVRGIHTFRVGTAVDRSQVRSNDTINYLGTYTFESLDHFVEGRPRSYTRRIGDPNIRYKNAQGAVYVQDDIRIRRNFTVSAGMRYEAQTHIRDYNNVAPRFGVIWAPFASGRTTLRSSWGIFYEWLPENTYEETLRVDGFRQQELNIVNPSYPDLAEAGSVIPTNRYLLSEDARSPRITRISAGIDQRVMNRFQTSTTYSYMRGVEVLRGLNRNAPAAGIRPNPLLGNIIEGVSDGRSSQHQLRFNATINPGALLPAENAPRLNWKRTTLFANYTFDVHENNSDGAFNVPATGSLVSEWGPANGHIRHRLNTQLNNQVIRNLQMGISTNFNSGSAYGIRTGRDENGDLIFNDRPEGVGRNTLLTDAHWTVNVFTSYNFVFGRRATPLPPGVGVFGGGGTATVQTFEQSSARYRLTIGIGAENLFNRANFTGYSGTMTSPHFRIPTAVSGPRSVQLFTYFNF